MVKVAIIGATGYTAAETIELLLRHPEAQVTYLTALPEECGAVTSIFPALAGRLDLDVEPIDLHKLTAKADVALCCLPHRASMEYVPKLLDAGLKVVDFSADYRLHDRALYESVYKVEHTDAGNLAQAAFGLPELFRSKIIGATLVANPGCYPTAASLALVPAMREEMIVPEDIVVNAVSGASGAGRKASLAFHFPEMNENYFAYSPGTHRHQPEIDQILNDAVGRACKVLFVPHVAAFDRGIAESIYCRPAKDVTPKQLLELYQSCYKNEPFIRVMSQPPKLKNVTRTNFVDIHPTVVGGKVVIFSAIDNLVKGASGQAIQNMNIICKLPETMGLL
ncbi:MAG: N-acetyl-gamma-glutamyl-phosphate reductase [Sedimentisphaerales bacterium]|nr:N-acetyl-gamma-glutamyl-phosphate reductase [Sedimentisphaerales bacterium]